VSQIESELKTSDNVNYLDALEEILHGSEYCNPYRIQVHFDKRLVRCGRRSKYKGILGVAFYPKTPYQIGKQHFTAMTRRYQRGNTPGTNGAGHFGDGSSIFARASRSSQIIMMMDSCTVLRCANICYSKLHKTLEKCKTQENKHEGEEMMARYLSKARTLLHTYTGDDDEDEDEDEDEDDKDSDTPCTVEQRYSLFEEQLNDLKLATHDRDWVTKKFLDKDANMYPEVIVLHEFDINEKYCPIFSSDSSTALAELERIREYFSIKHQRALYEIYVEFENLTIGEGTGEMSTITPKYTLGDPKTNHSKLEASIFHGPEASAKDSICKLTIGEDEYTLWVGIRKDGNMYKINEDAVSELNKPLFKFTLEQCVDGVTSSEYSGIYLNSSPDPNDMFLTSLKPLVTPTDGFGKNPQHLKITNSENKQKNIGTQLRGLITLYQKERLPEYGIGLRNPRSDTTIFTGSMSTTITKKITNFYTKIFKDKDEWEIPNDIFESTPGKKSSKKPTPVSFTKSNKNDIGTIYMLYSKKTGMLKIGKTKHPPSKYIQSQYFSKSACKKLYSRFGMIPFEDEAHERIHEKTEKLATCETDLLSKIEDIRGVSRAKPRKGGSDTEFFSVPDRETYKLVYDMFIKYMEDNAKKSETDNNPRAYE
jgi:hypothetical protein